MGSEQDDEAGNNQDGTAQSKKRKEPWWFNQPLPIDRFTGWIVLWTSSLFMATVGLGVFAALQWGELRDTDHSIAEQAKIATEQLEVMRARERAWISVSDPAIDGPLTFDGYNARVLIKLRLKNIGNLPTSNVVAMLHLYPTPLRGVAGVPRSGTCRERRGIGEFGAALFPNESTDSFGFYATTSDRVESTPIPKTGRFDLLVLGCVIYQSSGDPRPHVTSFAALLTPVNHSPGNPFGFDRSKNLYEAKELSIGILPIGTYAD